MTNSISNSDNVIDSRDIIARIEELEEFERIYKDAQDEVAGLEQAIHELTEEIEASKQSGAEQDIPGLKDRLEQLCDSLQDAKGERTAAESDFGEDEEQELDALRALAEEAEGCGDWRYGATLINEDYFVQYAEELADDIGAIDRNASWPINHIDWEAAADELKSDYTAVDFDGQTFWVRS